MGIEAMLLPQMIAVSTIKLTFYPVRLRTLKKRIGIMLQVPLNIFLSKKTMIEKFRKRLKEEKKLQKLIHLDLEQLNEIVGGLCSCAVYRDLPNNHGYSRLSSGKPHLGGGPGPKP